MEFERAIGHLRVFYGRRRCNGRSWTLAFAGIALQVSRAVLPRYRSRFSKRQFTQPQLLTILCLMRYEDWAFREAEVRLSEHRELRQVLGLGSVQDSTTLYRFLQRLDDQTIDHAVGETVRRLRGSLRQKRQRARVAVDATGLAQGAVSTFFVRRMHHHGQKPLPWRRWLKWVVAVDLDQQFVLSQLGRRGPWNDCANLPAVVETTSKQTRIGLVLAEAQFDSERNHTYIRQRLGAQSAIAAKGGKKTWLVHGVRAEMRRVFPQRIYRRAHRCVKPCCSDRVSICISNRTSTSQRLQFHSNYSAPRSRNSF